MICNRTKTNWFPAALAIASVCVVSPTVRAATKDSTRPVSYSSALPPISPTVVPVIAHGNNGAPPPPINIADAFARDPGLVSGSSLIDEMLEPDSHVPGDLSNPGALRALPEPFSSDGLDRPHFFVPHVGVLPTGQSGGAIPSPGTMALLGLSMLALGRRRRRT